ncbi:DUF6919 domain-containing protein [Streptomyces chartreusis]|uniref:DUF6919 domain-containing protein n=1 Tax=Streptomyces chartreusis TaxID=1969 RepID=UPI003696CB8B
MTIRLPWMSRRDRNRWKATQNIGQLGGLMALWLEGIIASWPGYQPNYGPDEETKDLIPTLVACNRAGYVTVGSQPGIDPAPGFDGKVWAQRAAVEGFVTDQDLLRRLVDAAETAGLEVELVDQLDKDAKGLTVTTRGGRAHTNFGGYVSGRHLRGAIWPGIGAGALDDVFRATRITLAAPEYGVASGALLWEVLDTVTGRIPDDVARCVVCGCTENTPCTGGCWWVPSGSMDDLCSACVGQYHGQTVAELTEEG